MAEGWIPKGATTEPALDPFQQPAQDPFQQPAQDPFQVPTQDPAPRAKNPGISKTKAGLLVLVLIIAALSLLLLRRSLGPRATPSSREGRGRAVEGEEEGAEEEKETDLPDDADDLLGAGDRDEDEERDEDKL